MRRSRCDGEAAAGSISGTPAAANWAAGRQRRLVLDHHDQHAVGGHQLRRAGGEVAIIRRQRDIGCVNDRLSGRVGPLVDPPLPAGRQADPDAVGGQVHAAPTTTASSDDRGDLAAQRDAPAGRLPAPQPPVHADEVGRPPHPAAGQHTQPAHRAEDRADQGAGRPENRTAQRRQTPGRRRTVVTTVTTPSPSWNPKPTPYTQPRYRLSQRSSTWRRTVGSRRPPSPRSAAIPATASSASAASASRGPTAPDTAAPSQTHQPADERARADGSDAEPAHRDPPSRVTARLTEPGDAAQHRLSSGRPRRPHTGGDREADAGHDDGVGGHSPASTCAEYRLG